MNPFQILFEIIITLIFARLFYKSEKPKAIFFFYGVLSYFIVLIIQLPVRYFEVAFKNYFQFDLMSQVIAAPFIIVIAEITKYFSMKKFLKTKSFKNGIFFGMGWITIESINYFTILFFATILSFFSITFDYSFLLNPQYSTLNFLFFFILNLGITILVVKSIVANKKFYLLLAILFSLSSYYGLLLLDGFNKYIFSLSILVLAALLIFHYKFVK